MSSFASFFCANRKSALMLTCTLCMYDVPGPVFAENANQPLL